MRSPLWKGGYLPPGVWGKKLQFEALPGQAKGVRLQRQLLLDLYSELSSLADASEEFLASPRGRVKSQTGKTWNDTLLAHLSPF